MMIASRSAPVKVKYQRYDPHSLIHCVFEATFNERTRALVNRYMCRQPEQLYRLDKDPFEMSNLADDAQRADVKARLSAEVDRWMEEQGKPGAAIDSEAAWLAAKGGNHFPPRKRAE